MKKEEILDRMVNANGWFDNVDKSKMSELFDLSYVKKYHVGEFVYMAGDQQNNIFLLFDGQVKISMIGHGGEEFMLTVWEGNSWFGEAGFVEGEGMPVEVRVTRDSQILVVPIKAIENTLGSHGGMMFYKNIMLDMIARSKLMYRLTDALLFKPLHARVAIRMLHLLQVYGEKSDEGLLLPLKFSQAEFAQMSGGSRQRVNQVFRKWADDGLVTKLGPNYIVRDLQELQAQIE